jgi:Glycosyl transferases group 1
MKGRFVEAALAGAVLVESRDSPARQWFEPGVDFLEWESTGEIENHILAADARREENEEMSQRLRNKIVERHSAETFWKETLGSIGL